MPAELPAVNVQYEDPAAPSQWSRVQVGAGAPSSPSPSSPNRAFTAASVPRRSAVALSPATHAATIAFA
ncbi:MAG: hypothetical protein U0P45_12590 [Acidimicrobiales bacterium]